MGKIVGNTVGVPNPQSDWNQTDETKADYIKNKPDITTIMEDISNAQQMLDHIPDLDYRIETNESDISHQEESIKAVTHLLQEVSTPIKVTNENLEEYIQGMSPTIHKMNIRITKDKDYEGEVPDLKDIRLITVVDPLPIPHSCNTSSKTENGVTLSTDGTLLTIDNPDTNLEGNGAFLTLFEGEMYLKGNITFHVDHIPPNTWIEMYTTNIYRMPDPQPPQVYFTEDGETQYIDGIITKVVLGTQAPKGTSVTFFPRLSIENTYTPDEYGYIAADSSPTGEMMFVLREADGNEVEGFTSSITYNKDINRALTERDAVIAELEDYIDTCIENINTDESRISDNEQNIKDIQNNISDINNKLNTLEANDITYAGDFYENEPNVEDAINYLGSESERINGLVAGNFKAIQKNKEDITAIQTNLSDKETRVSALEGVEKINRNTFANALKGSATGEAIALKDTSPVEHIMDVKVRKKNLLPYPFVSGTATSNGITFTDNNDGSLHIEGTLTAARKYIFSNNLSLKKGTYTISISIDGEIATGLFFYVRKTGVGNLVAMNLSNITSRTFTVTEDDSSIVVDLVMESSGVGNYFNFTIKPMLELGTVTTGWSPYIKDISAVKLNTLGKNLVDVTTAQLERSLYSGGSGSTVDIVGVEKSAGAAYAAVITYVPVLPNTTYSFSLNNSTYWLNRICQMNSNNICTINHAFYVSTANDYSEHTFTTNAYTRYLMIQLKNKNEVAPTMEDLLKINLQIEQGSATEYEPYKEPVEYAVNPDGTVTNVVSMYPNITLATDTIGAVIDCEYNRDINKAFAELANAIISLGGNV